MALAKEDHAQLVYCREKDKETQDGFDEERILEWIVPKDQHILVCQLWSWGFVEGV